MCDASGSFVYCNFRFWIGGDPVGDWNEKAVLGVLAHSATVILRYEGNRHLEQADTMSAELLWHHIKRFVNSDDPDDLRMGLEGRFRQRFLLHQLADDSVATVSEVIIVERVDGVQRLLWKSKDSNYIRETDLPRLTVDKTIADFLDWAQTVTTAK